MKIGRNDPCPCGSGKKYKKCCLDKDEAERWAANEAARLNADEADWPGDDPRFDEPVPDDPGYDDSIFGDPGLDDPVFDDPSDDDLSAESDEFRQFEEILQTMSDWLYDGSHDRELAKAAKRLSASVFSEKWVRDLAAGAFTAWLSFGYKTRDGQSFAQKYVAKFGKELPANELEILARHIVQPFRIMEVQDVRVGDGLTLKDLLSREVFEAQDRPASEQLVKWDMILARLCVLEHEVALATVMPIERTSMADLLERIDGFLRGMRQIKPTAQYADVLTDRLPEIVDTILEGHRRAMEPPALCTTDGEELIFCTATYRVSDAAAVREALAKHRRFEAHGDGAYTWISGLRRKGPFAQKHISLGNLQLTGDKLIFETRSKERLEKGKAFLEKTAGAHVQHLVDSFEDPMQALKNMPAAPPPSVVPPEIERQVVAKFQEEHYGKWPDEPLPGLDGMTPREASRDAAMRPVLIDMLKNMENAAARSPMPAYDFDKIRKALNLDE